MRTRRFVLTSLAAVGLLALLARAVNAPAPPAVVTAVAGSATPGTVAVHVQRQGHDERWTVDDGGTPGMQPVDEAGPQTSACAGDSCYRVAGDRLRVEHSTDGGRTFTTAWESAGAGASTSVVVHRVADGEVVYVANGPDGLLRRAPDGRWTRLGSPDSGEGCCFYDRPPGGAGPDAGPYVVAAVALTVLVTGAVTAARRRRWPMYPALVVLAALTGYLSWLGAHQPGVGMFPGLFYGAPCIALSLLGGAFLATRYTRRPGHDTEASAAVLP